MADADYANLTGSNYFPELCPIPRRIGGMSRDRLFFAETCLRNCAW